MNRKDIVDLCELRRADREAFEARIDAARTLVSSGLYGPALDELYQAITMVERLMTAGDADPRLLFAGLPPEAMAALLASLDGRTEPFTPLPGPQTAAYESEADELLYGGAAGGG
jgi:hypothetical protein